MFLNASGEVLRKPRVRTVECFRATGEFLAAQERALSGGKVDAELLVLSIEVGEITATEAKARRPQVELDEYWQQRYDIALRNATVSELIDSIRRDRRNDENRNRVGDRFLTMFRAGEIPSEAGLQPGFYVASMRAAERQRDAESYEATMKWVWNFFSTNYPNDERARPETLRKWHSTLESLKQNGRSRIEKPPCDDRADEGELDN